MGFWNLCSSVVRSCIYKRNPINSSMTQQASWCCLLFWQLSVEFPIQENPVNVSAFLRIVLKSILKDSVAEISWFWSRFQKASLEPSWLHHGQIHGVFCKHYPLVTSWVTWGHSEELMRATSENMSHLWHWVTNTYCLWALLTWALKCSMNTRWWQQ